METRFFAPVYYKEKSHTSSDRDDERSQFPERSKIESFERLGFFTVINNSNSTRAAYEEMLQEYKQERQLLWQKEELVHNSTLERLYRKIREFETSLDDEKRAFASHSHEALTKNPERMETLKKEIAHLEKEIEHLKSNLAEQDKTFIKDKLKQVREDLDDLLSTIFEMAEKNQKFYDQNNVHHKTVLKRFTDFWDNLAERYEKVMEALNERSIGLFKDGITRRVAYFFTVLGLLATGMAGWLFAIFSSIRKIDDEDWKFFFLESLYRFAEDIRNTNGLADWQWILFFLSSFLTLLILTTFIGWICHILYGQWVSPTHEDTIPNSALDDTLHDTTMAGKKVRGKAKSFLALWLRWMPYVFVLSILYVVVQLGTDVTKLRALDVSLSGQVVGSTLALVIGGLGFAYITHIIAPRFNDIQLEDVPKRGFKSSIRFFGQSFELILLLLVFLTTFVVMYINEENGAGALIGFVAVSLLSGYLLGTGIRYYGLLDAKKELEAQLWIASHNANHYLGRLNLSPHNTSESLVFKNRLMILEKNLMDMLVQRNTSFNKVGSNPKKMNTIRRETRKSTNTNGTATIKNKFWRRVLHFFGIRSHKDISTKESTSHYETTQFTKHQEEHYPEKIVKIKEKEREYHELKEELKRLKQYAQDFEEERTAYQRELKIFKQAILERIDQCEQEITEELRRHSGALLAFKTESREQRAAIDNGHDLGLWHLKYGTNGTSD